MLKRAFLTNPETNVPLVLGVLWLHKTWKDIKICDVVLQGICFLDAKRILGQMCIVQTSLPNHWVSRQKKDVKSLYTVC